MKQLLTIILFAISSFAFAQPVGIKMNPAQTFTVVPLKTAVFDSIFASVTDNGVSVYVDLDFFKPSSKDIFYGKRLVLWSGAEYTKNQNWTNATVLARIKELLNIQ